MICIYNCRVILGRAHRQHCRGEVDHLWCPCRFVAKHYHSLQETAAGFRERTRVSEKGNAKFPRMALQVALALSGLEPEGLFSCGLPKSSSSSSIASSSGASSYYSMESGISSMSPDSVSYQHILTRSSFETLVLNALQHKSAEVAKNRRSDDGEEEATATKRAARKTIRHAGRNLLNLGSNIMGGWKYQTAKLPDGVGSYFENRSQYSRLQGALPPHHTKVICTDKDCSFIEPIYF